MHSLWYFFLEKRQFSWLIIISLIGIGTYSVTAIPKESAPEVIVPIGIITTVYPGASASDIEELITNKIEDAIENIDDLENLTSVSRDGISTVTAEFNASADIDNSIQDLKDAVETAKNDLPRDAEDPFVTEVNFADQPIVVVAISSKLPAVAFTELGDTLEDEFKAVNGLSKVIVSGTRERQYQVIVREKALTAYDLDINALTTALSQGNLSTPVGTVVTEGVEYSIRFAGKLQDVSDIELLPIGTKSGVPVYLKDVATIAESVDTQTSLSRVSTDGQPSDNAMTLSMYKKAGFDVTTMADGVHKKLAELQAEGGLLESSQVLVVFDQGEQVRKDLTELIKAGSETVLLVVFSLLLTIGWRESLVAALSIPLSFVIAFIGLYASGNTINFVSLFALILSVGILVDSGIVITEAIHTRQSKVGDPAEAARLAIKEYAWPLIGGTLTTVAVFAPLFFLSGVTGEFIKSIPFTIIFVLLASIVVALAMVPLIAILVSKSGSSNRLEELQEKYTHRVQSWYRSFLVRFLQNRLQQRIFLWTLFAGFILSLALPVTGLLKVIFFPPEDVDYVFVEIEAKQGTPLLETDLTVRAVEEILYDKDYVVAFASTVGGGSSFTGSTDTGAKFANITVKLKEEREQSSAVISDDLRQSFAGITNANISISEQQNGPPTGAPIVVKFVGDDLSSLVQAAESAESLLNSIKGTRDVETSTKSNATEFVLTIDRAKAAAAGITPTAIAGTLRAAVFGLTATTINDAGTDVDVVVKLALPSDNATDPAAAPQVTLESLRSLSILNMRGERILLSSVLTESLASANAAIDHEDGERIVSVTAYTVPGAIAGEITNTFRDRASELNLPADITVSYGGETEDVNQSFTEMFIALIVGLLLMLAILVLSFNSIRYSLYLLLAVPYSLIGVFGGLTLAGLALSFTSLLGVIALSGVIINHAIILMDSLITQKASQGTVSLIDQVADASVSRLRPIFLTTITTVVGMIPLSTISDFWSPLAFAIMFGLAFAMILTLLLVPLLFYRHQIKLLAKNKLITA
jgi:multidrug efflux pump subunit AcrB